jgi:hypothetical protein
VIKLKKSVCIFLAVVLMFCCASCASKKNSTNTSTTGISFKGNDTLSEIYGYMTEVKNLIKKSQSDYKDNSDKLRISLEKIINRQSDVNTVCTADEFTVILGVYNKFCKNAQEFEQSMDLYELGKGKLDKKLENQLILNIEDYEKCYLGK